MNDNSYAIVPAGHCQDSSLYYANAVLLLMGSALVFLFFINVFAYPVLFRSLFPFFFLPPSVPVSSLGMSFLISQLKPSAGKNPLKLSEGKNKDAPTSGHKESGVEEFSLE